MSESEITAINKWEAIKKIALNSGLTIVIRKGNFDTESSATEAIYFTTRDLQELSIYVNAYAYGVRDAIKT